MDYFFEHYARSFSKNTLANDIEKETEKLFPHKKHMLCGQQVGELLKLMRHITMPQHIVEVGTFTGYSTSFLLGESTAITSIDNNPTYQEVAQRMLSASKYYTQIRFVCQDATQGLQSITSSINLAFIDANKKAYKTHYLLIKEKMPSGGIIIIDNALFHGEVYQKNLKENSIAESIHEFNQYLAQDNEVESCLLNIRDGLWVARKK